MNGMSDTFEDLSDEIRSVIDGDEGKNEKLQRICELLFKRVVHYDWVGFYLVDPERERELILGPFAGEPTEHTSIPFGKGICGQAADLERTFVIQDVTSQDNYLSCSINVLSEIVVPIFKNDQFIGELDIDSHSRSPFTVKERIWLEGVCEMISHCM